MEDDVSRDLAELTADLKAWLLDARGCGVLELPRAVETDRHSSAVAPAVPSAPVRREARVVRSPQPVAVSPEATVAAGPEMEGPLGVIRRDLGDCSRCALSQGRKHLVFGAGSPEADLMIIGEAPGGQEDRIGLPFVGPAGRMLENMLCNVLELQREQVYITNVVKCRPPGNRTPHPEEISTCKGFLDQQIEAIQPKVILALGRPASQALLGTTQGIKAMRGNWGLRDDIPVLPTFHPAYLLRQPQDKRLVFDDLKALRKRYDELGGLR